MEIKGFNDLYDSLRNMVKGSVIEDYKLESGEKVNIVKRSLLGHMPNTLIVHLNRIMFSFDTGENDKINTYFKFPEVLDLKDFSYKGFMKENSDSELEDLLGVSDDEYVYRLAGINIHTGTADAGHYYSLINTKRG